METTMTTTTRTRRTKPHQHPKPPRHDDCVLVGGPLAGQSNRTPKRLACSVRTPAGATMPRYKLILEAPAGTTDITRRLRSLRRTCRNQLGFTVAFCGPETPSHATIREVQFQRPVSPPETAEAANARPSEGKQA